uniref:SH3GL interacting endocytic adaptor 1b n=1 Tax=Sinocyclocheilus anshuiensis TaxID=1608454 RepID=A0A671KEJ2_9TELE
LLTGLKKRTRKAFGIRKKEKDSDSTGSPDKDKSKKANGAPNGYYGEIDWDRYNSPDVDDEGYNSPAPKVKMLFSSSESEGEEEHGKKFKIKIKPLTANSGNCTVSTMDELKASVGTLAISPSPLVRPSSPARAGTPLSAGSPIPPLPPRPSSRPKLPPGKPNLADLARPFSPPIHSWSPPPFAPLARAESTSSISSVTSLSAASTPTLACSRGPSPLTMGPQDTLPVAAAFTETISAYFKGADPTKCLVKITGEMVLSFPAGITRHFSSHPSPPVLTFTISQYNRLEQVLPNPQLLCCDTTPPTGDSKEFWVNMSSLLSHLRKVAEQKPQATYYNVDMLKYQVFTQGIQSTPLNLAVSWRGDANSTDLRIDYKYNIEDNKSVVLSLCVRVSGVGALLARFQLAEGPSRPSQLAVQFSSEGSNLSGCDFQLVGSGYRLSLVKKRFSAGKYLADN